MKAINIKLASFTFAAMLLASCSDSNESPLSPSTPQDVVGKEVTSITDAQTLASRVYNFKVSATSRAADVPQASMGDVYNMPEKPNVPADAIEIVEAWNPEGKPYSTTNLQAGKSYLVKKGMHLKSSLNLNGATLYVEGELTIDNFWGNSNGKLIDNNWVTSNGKLIVLGGTVNINSDKNDGNVFLSTGVNLYNYDGKITYNNSSSSDFFISANDEFYTNTDLDLNGKALKVQGKFYAGGKVTTSDLKSLKGAFVNIQGGTEGLENTDVKLDGIVNIDGHAKFKSLTLENSGQLYCCSLELTGDFKSMGGDGAGSALHTSYLKAKNLLLASSNNIYLVNNSSIEVEGTLQCNKNASAMIFLQGVNSKAYIKANVIKYNGSGSPASLNDCYMFNAMDTGGEYYIDADHFDNSSPEGGNLAFSDIQFLGSGKTHNFRNNSAPVTLEKAECGYTLKPDVPTPPHIDEIGEVLYDHTHDISATCIQEYNGKLYMSYHTRGKGHGGCIEVFETDANKQTKLLQYLQDKDNTMDFNHLMIDSKSSTPNLYVVGNYAYHNEAGKQTEANGLMARIGINSSGLLDTDVKNIGDAFVNPLIIVPLDQTTQSSSLDENAIIRDGDKLLITSTRGYEVYDPNTLELLNSKPTPGKAKHIAINGNEIAALYYTTRPSDKDAAVDAKLDLFDAGANIATATPKKTIDIASITPNNGKNTIAIDGENIYVCRSANGLTCYDKNGTEKWTWQAPLTASTKKPQGYANGVTYDNNYVYLACGGYGLVVLDKNEMEKGKPKVVAKTRVTGVVDETTGKISWNSANYVKLYNGLIYVAYGKNRLKIYQLVDKNASGAGTSYETEKKQTKK